MTHTFKEGDVVVVDDPNYNATEYPYDYGLWAQTRMEITLVEGNFITAQAIDERPDRAVILARRGIEKGSVDDPQDVHMYWPANLLKLAS